MNRKELKYKKEEDRFLSDIDWFRDDEKLVEQYITGAGVDYFKMIPDGEHKCNLLRKIYRNTLKNDPQKGHHLVQITDKEIEFLQKLPNDTIKRLFYSLIIRAKVKPHKTGWISMDFENTIYYGFPDKEARNTKIEAFAQCTEYGFETLVIGSTNPVLCFKLPIESDGDVVMEFEDGEARDKYEEVVGFDCSY
jgi:hypothetical protein